MNRDDRSELILAVATEGFWDWDLKTDRAYLSPRYCELVGHSPDDTVFDSHFFRSIIHPDDREQVFETIAKHLSGAIDLSLAEYRVISRDGSMRWIEGRGKIVAYDEEGAPSRMVGTIVDISDRKNSAREAFALISGCPGLMVARVDQKLHHQRVLPSIEEITGLAGHHSIGKNNPEAGMSPELVQQWESALGKVWEKHQPQQIEFSPDGSNFFLSYLMPEFSSDGSVAHAVCVTLDISEQKQAAETLKKSQNLLDNLSQQVPGILFQTTISPEGKPSTSYASSKSYDIYELSPEEICRDITTVFNRFHPEDHDRVMASLQGAIRSSTLWQCEYRVVLPRQGVKWVYGTAQTQQLEDGSTMMYGIIMDASELKRAEESLRLSEKKYSTVFHTSPDAIILTRRSDWRYLEVNDGFAQLTGYQVETAIGNSALGLNIWVDASERQRLVQELDAHGSVRGMVAQFRRKDGSILLGQLSSCVIEIDGEPCLLSMVRDVTEHYQAVQAIRDNEENLRTIMEAIPVGIAICDDHDIEYINSTFAKHYGYLLQEIPSLEKWFLQAYPDPAYREALVSAWKSALDEARRTNAPVPAMEAMVTCKDGTVRHTLANTQIFRDRILVIFTDITEHDLLQRELLKIQELESLGVLAGGIAHDFNNILTGIMGNISLARMFIEASQDASPALDRAEQASLRAAGLAKQLLVFARGGHPVKREIRLEKVVAEAVALALSGTTVKAVLDIPEPLHAVEADGGQISQSLHNIVINATQAMTGGGKLTVSGRNVLLEARNSLGLGAGSYVEISIADEGCGIAKENLTKIFDPYFTTKPGGTGLGLATTYAIIAKHNGHVAVSSAVGRGTTFSIYLPSTGKAAAEPDKEAEAGTGDHAGGAILVMDDEELVSELAARALARAGYTVRTCENGEKAVTLYLEAKERGTPFAVAIMDLTIPGGMGGVEAARRILSFDPDAVLIVSSGYSADPVMAQFSRYGFSGAIAKPYKAEQLLQAIGKARQAPG